MPHRSREYRSVLLGVARSIGGPGGLALVREALVRVGALTGAHCLLAGRLTPDAAAIETVAMAVDGKLAPNTVYDIEAVPCQETVATRRTVFLGKGVSRAFPNGCGPQGVDVEAYIGQPIFRADGTVAGLMVALFREPQDSPESMLPFFDVMCARLAPEFESEETAKRFRMELDEVHSRLNRLADNVPGFLYQYRIDAEGHHSIPYFSQGFYRHDYAATLQAFIKDGVPDLGLVHEDDLPALMAAYEQAMKAPQDITLELRLRHPERGWVWFATTANPERTADGAVLWHGYCREVTEEIEAQRKAGEFERALLQSRKLEALGRLAGGVAHEFNNILTPILLLSRQTRNASNDPEIRHNLSLIEDAALKARSVVRSIMDFARPEGDDLDACDLAAELRKAAEVADLALRKSVTVELDLSEQPHAADIRPGTVSQVVLNIVRNAGEAGGTGTKVRIVLRPHEGAGFRLSFLDDGPGIDPEILPHVFEPFFTTKSAQPGAGMGLAAVYGIVRSWGGSVTAGNRAEGGAEFRIEVPGAGPPD